MRIKTLSILIIFLFTSFGITSCLESDNDTIELSTDDTIHAFELDKIYGVNYKFSIDQVQRLIYNQDSVPMSADTIIDNILIKTMQTVSGYIETGDTLFNINDSVNFLTSMDVPLEFTVYAQDGGKRTYRVKVLRHKLDPDTLVWTRMSSSFSGGVATGNSKTVILNETLYVFTESDVYTSSVADGSTWTKQPTSLPVGTDLSNILIHGSKLYVSVPSGRVLSSENGIVWDNTSLSDNMPSTVTIISLIASFPDYISGIISIDGELYFAKTNSELTSWNIKNTTTAFPTNFPTENTHTTVYVTNTGIYKALMMGKSKDSDPEKTVPWATTDGFSWAELETDLDFSCPYWENPTILHYNDQFYAFGTGFEKFYTSTTGLVWNPDPEKVIFDPGITGRTNYSVAVDGEGFIWLIFPKDASGNDEVWKGRINKLGFDRK